jgi:hypothetical protein
MRTQDGPKRTWKRLRLAQGIPQLRPNVVFTLVVVPSTVHPAKGTPLFYDGLDVGFWLQHQDPIGHLDVVRWR